MITNLLGHPSEEEMENVTLLENLEFLQALPKKKPLGFDMQFNG